MSTLRNSPRALAGALSLITVALLAVALYHLRERDRDDAADTSAAAAPASPIEIDRFSARLEKSNDEERLAVSLRLRGNNPEPIDCYVFLVAMAEAAGPKPWAIWPVTSPGMVISAGGHFHAAHPASGHPLSLGTSWERIDAVLPAVADQPPFDSVVVYVVSPAGNVLLARPFAL